PSSCSASIDVRLAAWASGTAVACSAADDSDGTANPRLAGRAARAAARGGAGRPTPSTVVIGGAQARVPPCRAAKLSGVPDRTDGGIGRVAAGTAFATFTGRLAQITYDPPTAEAHRDLDVPSAGSADAACPGDARPGAGSHQGHRRRGRCAAEPAHWL